MYSGSLKYAIAWENRIALKTHYEILYFSMVIKLIWLQNSVNKRQEKLSMAGFGPLFKKTNGKVFTKNEMVV